MLHTLSLINESTVVTDEELAKIAPALQKQINRDFREHWFTNAEVVAIEKGDTPAEDTWWIVVADDTQVANALGYHDLTPDLHPVALIGAQTDLDAGASLSVTISHEALEMLGDPRINLLVEDPHSGREYAYENCDACEADEFGYRIDGILVSDFVLPEYFDPTYRGKHAPLDFAAKITEPFSLLPGGYLSYREIGGDGEWKQVTADSQAESKERSPGQRATGFPHGSRRERRLRASRKELMVSEVVPHRER